MTNEIKYALIDFQRFIQFIMIFLGRKLRMLTSPLIHQNNTCIHYTATKPMTKDMVNSWKEIENNVDITYYSYNDCLLFIKNHCNKRVLKSFETISPGWKKVLMFKLIVMYMKNGLFIDPNMIFDVTPDILREHDISSYIVVSDDNQYVNMMMMANMTTRHSTLFLTLLLAYLITDDEHFDLYKTLCYNIGTLRVEGDEQYRLEQVKYQVEIGSSKRGEKIVDLVWFPEDELYNVKCNTFSDEGNFIFYIQDSKMYVVSKNGRGWSHTLVVDIYFQTNEILYTLVEERVHRTCKIKKEDVVLIHHD